MRGLGRPASWLWWALAVILSGGLVVVSGTAAARSAQDAAAGLMRPVQEALGGAASAIADVADAIGEIGQLRAENGELRSRLAAAEQRIAELTEAARENERLRDLLGLEAVLDWELVPARVTTVGTSALEWEVGIDVGRDHGLRTGMAVVGAAEGGGALAGVVIEVRDHQARVRLIVDPRSRVVGRDQATKALGVIQGQPGGQLVMVQVALGDEVAVGDPIVSAGLAIEGVAASPYPGGLLIGQVTAIEADANGLTQTVFVRPALDPRRVDWLMVVLDSSEITTD
ncbi:MAG TPA: rod shape-determining protein MreC [Candidatus Limnocylindria bacterium]|nr:rod shape-determining protein MreC [Candidatus Limnocylindria bacterium]